MRVKKAKLEWNIIYFDFNTNKAKTFNFFNKNFVDEMIKLIKNSKIKNREDLKKYISRETFYYYHSRVEWEAIIGWVGEKDISKLDKISLVYDQIIANLDNITDYVIYKMQIDFKGDKQDDEESDN